MKKLFDLIVSPSEEIYRMSRFDPGFGGFTVLIVAVLSCVTAGGLVIGIPAPLKTFMLTWSVIIRLIVWTVLILIVSAVYHYFASLLGGRANPLRTFKGMLYTSAPFCFLVPAALISRAWGGITVYLFFFLAALIYAVLLQFKLINYFYGLNSSRSAVALFFPWIVIFAAVLVSIVFLSAGLITAVV